MKSIDRFIQKISPRTASRTLIILPSILLIFHGLVITGVLPKNIVWGGRLTDQTLIPFELLAISITLILMLVGAVAGGFVTSPTAVKFVHWIKWFLFYFMVVNTILALFSTTLFERLITPVTAIYAICLYRLIKFPDGLTQD